MNAYTHPVFGTGPEWEVTNYTATVELFNRDTRQSVCIPKPYEAQSSEWWTAEFKMRLEEGGVR